MKSPWHWWGGGQPDTDEGTDVDRALECALMQGLLAHADEWKFSQHTATWRGVVVWVANAPYADLSIGSFRIAGPARRARLRKALREAEGAQALKQLHAAPVKKRGAEL